MVMPSTFDDMTYNRSKRGEGAQFKMNFSRQAQPTWEPLFLSLSNVFTSLP